MSRPRWFRRRALRAALASTWFAAPAAPTAAQAPAPTPARPRLEEAPPPPGACFRGRPLPRCRTFALFELGYHPVLAGTQQAIRGPAGVPAVLERDLPSYAALEVGAMRNRGSAHALGATLHLGVADGGARVGLRARHRTWLGGGGTVDLAAGPLGSRVRGPGYDARRVWAYGATAEAALGWRDLAAFTVGADALRGAGRTRVGVHAGARLGSYPAVVGTGVLAAGVAFLFAALSQGD